MSAAELAPEALDAALWAALDAPRLAPASGPDAAEGQPTVLSRLAEPLVARRFAELCLDHVLLRELFQEEHASQTRAAEHSDARLVQEAIAQVPGAFDVLVQRYIGLVTAAAYAVIADAEAARDVAQEAFLQAASTLTALRNRAKFGPWVYGIARRKAIYALRRRKLHHTAILHKQERDLARAAPDEPGAPIARRERLQEIRRALAQLPEIYREVLVLRYMDGRSYAEIGEILGLSEAAVDKRLTRAKDLLRVPLQRWISE